jgi:hypothetical protein
LITFNTQYQRPCVLPAFAQANATMPQEIRFAENTPPKQTWLGKTGLLSMVFASIVTALGGAAFHQHRHRQVNDVHEAQALLESEQFKAPAAGVTFQFSKEKNGRIYLTQIEFENPDFVLNPWTNPEGFKRIKPLLSSTVYWHQISTMNVERKRFESLENYLKRVHQVSNTVSDALLLPTRKNEPKA